MRILILVALVPLSLSSGCSKPLSPNAFLTKAIEGDNSEMTLGALAANKGGSAVADYGRTLVTDHTKGRADAVAVAQHYGLIPTSNDPDSRWGFPKR